MAFLITQWWYIDIFIVTVFLYIVIYLYFKLFTFNYWKKRGLSYIKPTFPFGNIQDLIFQRKTIGDAYIDIYNQLKGNKLGGIYQLHLPTLVLIHPDTIKQFLVKDFNSFHDRGVYYDAEKDPLMNNLFMMEGNGWKENRTKLTPTFTSGKMKMMYHTVFDCGNELNKLIKTKAEKEETIEINDILARFSTDVIASCAFGIQCNCLTNPDAEFRKTGRKFFQRGALGKLGMAMNFFAPGLAAVSKLGVTPREITDFFIDVVKETVAYREKNNEKRKDFMDLLIQLKNKGFVEGDGDTAADNNVSLTDPSKKLQMDDLAAQAFVFFLAGFETSSTTMTFCLYELAVNPDLQRRVTEEIDAVAASHGGQITYEDILQMDYLDMVVAETLRKYPVLTILNRECNKPVHLDSGLVVEPGVKVVIPVYALHHDPEYYPEPQRFDPERFTKEEKAKRNPYTYLPFGEGPRNCIGMRFGLMQTKIGLISLLKSYEFRVSAKTVVPIVIDPKLFLLASQNGVFLQVVKRNNSV